MCVGGDHFGRDKTLHKVTSRYYWKNVSLDVKKYVASCDCCQRVNTKLRKEVGLLHPIKVDNKVWLKSISIII